MNVKTAGLLLLAVGVVAAVLLLQNCGVTPQVKNDSSSQNSAPTEINTTVESVEPSDVAPAELASTDQIETVQAPELDPAIAAERAAFHKRFDLSQIGSEPLDDGEFNALVAYLKNDSELFAQFLTQYRETTDPDRSKRLAQVLDEFDDSTITTLAEELVFSGDVGSQVAGLDLLSGQQANNPQAREVVSQVLELETNPVVISSALNAMATPGEVTSEERTKLLNQFVMHSSNDDAAVRGRSLALMKRWGGDTNMNEHYIVGLQDSDDKVRIGALLSLASSKHPGDDTFQALVSVVEDLSMDMQSRKTAMRALDKYDLADEEKQRLLGVLAGN